MSDKEQEDLLARLIADSLRGRVSRRGFMEGALATGLATSSATALWGTKVAAQTPRRGGVLRVGMHDANTGDSLDPATTESVYMIQLSHCFRNYLTEIRNTGGVGPDAALSWSASPDASEWRFELAPNMEFHSGKKFTSADAVASLNYHRGDKTTSAAKALLSDVKDIRADGPHAIVITLNNGNADLPFIVTDYHLVMLPADEAGNVDWKSGDGAGPYKIVQHEPGVGTELTRFENYHREGLAHFDGVKLIGLSDTNARQSALLTNEVDIVSQVNFQTAKMLARNPNIMIEEVASGTHVTMPMFVDTKPFDNNDVRMALKLAINREEIVTKILSGYGTPGNDHPIAPNMPYYAEIEQRTYDPDKAKFHLKKAGAEGLKINLSAADAAFNGAVDMAVLFREHAAAAGIDVNVVREPNDGYWSDVWLKKPFVVVAWGERPTPDIIFSLAYKQGAAWNESHWNNETFNKLLLEARSELDQARRAELYAQMQLLCRDEGGTIVPFFRNRVLAHTKNLAHEPEMAGNWELDGARIYQRWWFTS